MTTSHYDIVVAGTDLAGVILALCAKRGYRTLLTGNGSLPNRYTQGGAHSSDVRNFSLDASQSIQEVMGSLSMALHMRGRPLKERSLSGDLAGGAVTVTGSASALAKHLTREYGEPQDDTLFPEPVHEERGAIDRFLAGAPPLPPEGWNERREFQKNLEMHPRIADSSRVKDPLRFARPGTPLHRFWEAPLEATSSMDLELASPIPRHRALHLLRGGVFEVNGGVDTYGGVYRESPTILVRLSPRGTVREPPGKTGPGYYCERPGSPRAQSAVISSFVRVPRNPFLI